jgi:hypothetical protein
MIHLLPDSSARHGAGKARYLVYLDRSAGHRHRYTVLCLTGEQHPTIIGRELPMVLCHQAIARMERALAELWQDDFTGSQAQVEAAALLASTWALGAISDRAEAASLTGDLTRTRLRRAARQREIAAGYPGEYVVLHGYKVLGHSPDREKAHTLYRRIAPTLTRGFIVIISPKDGP